MLPTCCLVLRTDFLVFLSPDASLSLSALYFCLPLSPPNVCVLLPLALTHLLHYVLSFSPDFGVRVSCNQLPNLWSISLFRFAHPVNCQRSEISSLLLCASPLTACCLSHCCLS